MEQMTQPLQASVASPVKWGSRPHAAGLLAGLKQMDLKKHVGTSLVAQWLRICLPMQGTRVRALVQEDPT